MLEILRKGHKALFLVLQKDNSLIKNQAHLQKILFTKKQIYPIMKLSSSLNNKKMTNPQPTKGQFAIALAEWLGRAEKIAGEGTLSVAKGGKKFIKILTTRWGQVSAFCFIEVATGNVLKTASWNAPAKGRRGNIYEIGNEGVGEFGAHYLR